MPFSGFYDFFLSYPCFLLVCIFFVIVKNYVYFFIKLISKKLNGGKVRAAAVMNGAISFIVFLSGYLNGGKRLILIIYYLLHSTEDFLKITNRFLDGVVYLLGI